MALITAAEARELVPALTGTAEDTFLDTLIARCGAAFARRCGYPPASAGVAPSMESLSTYTLDHDGRGGRDLTLRVWPATAISSVRDDPTLDFTSDTYLVTSTDYAIVDQGRTLRLKSTATWGSWGRGEGRIRVAFTAGYTAAAAPSDLKQLVAQAVHHWIDQRQTQGKKSVSQGGQVVTYDDSAFLPPWVEGALGGFMHPSALA